MKTPKAYYLELLDSGKFKPDPIQAQAIDELDRVYHELMQQQQLKHTFRHRLTGNILLRKNPILGVYLWGSVGIGKTWLMDIFYHCLPQNLHLRMHFHRFMRQIHGELKQLQGTVDPLKVIAKRIAAKTPILCFDEFVVLDITDAMLLAGLLTALFNEGVTLVTTSNSPPDDLYKKGIQRERFLPAIALIKQNTRILHLPSTQDYRVRSLAQAGIYYWPLSEKSQQAMRERFLEFAGDHWQYHELLIIDGRAVPTIRSGHSVVWFSFEILCNIPRSRFDYLELARSYQTVLLSNVTAIGPHQDNIIQYFINLIDIFYDARVKLIISATVPIEKIYQEGKFLQDYQRTKSRLIEMQSLEYLHEPHIGVND